MRTNFLLAPLSKSLSRLAVSQEELLQVLESCSTAEKNRPRATPLGCQHTASQV